jgi:hypothetical protein
MIQRPDFSSGNAIHRIINDLRPIQRRMAVILFSNNTSPAGVTESMNNAGAHITVYQAGLPGWRKGWTSLAEAYGGYAVTTESDHFPEIATILHDLDQCYLLGYIPDDKTLDVKSNVINTSSGPRTSFRIDFHSLKVKTNVRDAKVRTWESFSNTDLLTRRTPFPSANSGRFVKVMTTSPFITGELVINSEAIPYFSPKQESMIRVILNVKGNNLRFLPEPGKNLSTSRVAITGQLSFDGRIVQTYNGIADLQMRQREVQKPENEVYTTSFDVAASNSGLYVLKTSVMQARGGLVGNTTILVEVPDFTKSGLVASGIATYPLSKDPEASSQPQLVTRRMNRADPFGCSLSVYNAKREESSGSARIESQVRLYRDDKLVQASEIVPVADQGRDSISKGIAVNFGVTPNPDLKAGNYLLEVLVIDKLAGNKNNTTAQTVAIELLE